MQAVAFARNNQLSTSQLDTLSNISSNSQRSDGTRKSSLQQLTALNSAIKTVGQLGGVRTQALLAEMTESNAKLSQLENFEAAFNALACEGGMEGAFDASSLEQLQQQFQKFASDGSLGQMSQQAAKLAGALSTALDEQIGSQDGGVKSEVDLVERIDISAISRKRDQ